MLHHNPSTRAPDPKNRNKPTTNRNGEAINFQSKVHTVLKELKFNRSKISISSAFLGGTGTQSEPEIAGGFKWMGARGPNKAAAAE